MNIRIANSEDAPRWLELFQATFGADYPARVVYDLKWIAAELSPGSGNETWVIEGGGRFFSSVTFLARGGADADSIANLARNLHRSESLVNGAAESLLRAVCDASEHRHQMVVTRIPALANSQQILYENLGFSCAGFQPLKHQAQQRLGVLFYVRPFPKVLARRAPVSESLPDVAELAAAVFELLRVGGPQAVARDGMTGYPLQNELPLHNATPDGYALWRTQAQTANPVAEVSGQFNLGFGQMRIPTARLPHALLCQKADKMVAGLQFYHDEMDRCARITDSFSTDGFSTGALFSQAVKVARDSYNAVYTEVDILASAPRLLKSAEQLGFVPVAYLPGFCGRNTVRTDVVKMVKFNSLPESAQGDFTSQAARIVRIIDQNFEDQKIGQAIIRLLGGLAMFSGLGDGELRKISRLFTQKLYRPGQAIFARGDVSSEAYIVVRGQVDIVMEPGVPPLASLKQGKIFGELAFLDGAPRSTGAVAAEATILLVMERTGFFELVRREPALGLCVMRNLAIDLAAKLRQADVALGKIPRQ